MEKSIQVTLTKSSTELGIELGSRMSSLRTIDLTLLPALSILCFSGFFYLGVRFLCLYITLSLHRDKKRHEHLPGK